MVDLELPNYWSAFITGFICGTILSGGIIIWIINL